MESLECPRCGCVMSRVLETRWIEVRTKHIKIRVRECRHCKKQYRSKEIVDLDVKLPAKSRSKPKPVEEEQPKPPSSDNPFL